jgi:hypothetical protein
VTVVTHATLRAQVFDALVDSANDDGKRLCNAQADAAVAVVLGAVRAELDTLPTREVPWVDENPLGVRIPAVTLGEMSAVLARLGGDP